MAVNQYRTDQNKGLSSSFVLVNGRFELTGGELKAQDNMRVLLSFSGWFRDYYQDFCVDLYWLMQKPTSFVQIYKTIIISRFKTSAEKYIPFIKVAKCNIFNSTVNRKEVQVGVEFAYVLNKEENFQYVTFV